MKSGPVPLHNIELRIRQLAQLFNSMDPTPFLIFPLQGRNHAPSTQAIAAVEIMIRLRSKKGGAGHISVLAVP